MKKLLCFTIFCLVSYACASNFLYAMDQKKYLPDAFWDDSLEIISNDDRALIADSKCPIVSDTMEEKISSENWNLKFLKPKNRFSIQNRIFTEGKKSLAINLKKGDQLNGAHKYKHELRIATPKRCNFGDEVWYSFSFFIDGSYPTSGSTRWVIGQWKEESGASPFLAQRFDNGVFHISIQRNEYREIIATAPGDYNQQFKFLSGSFRNSLKMDDDNFDDNTNIEKQAQDYGPTAFDFQSLRKAIKRQDLSKFPFVADPENYRKIEGLSIEIPDGALLPNPTSDWVHMRYRVRGGRKGNGLVEVWANGKLIARAVGKIGSDDFKGPTQYFKFGHYRDIDKKFQYSNIYIDQFKRGKKRGDVD